MASNNHVTTFDLSLGLEGTHVLVTGGCGLIGRVVSKAFLSAGCYVTIIDLATEILSELDETRVLIVKADITNESQMDSAFATAEDRFGPIATCIALASLDLSVLPQSESLADMDVETWKRVFDVNIHGTFLTCQRWLRGIRAAAADPTRADQLRNVSLVIMGSESGRFGVRTMPAYAAGKSAVQGGLLLSLAQDAPRLFARARVNAVAPGAVDTDRFKDETARYGQEWRWRECEATVPMAKAVLPEDVARTIVFLASERFSGSVHGQLIPIDAGKTGNVIWTPQELQSAREAV